MQSINLLTTNSKLKKDGIYCFNLPAIKTCPFAGSCKEYCYASKGCFRFPVVKAAAERNFKATRKESFVTRMIAEIIHRSIHRVRIHASGDFYSSVYLTKWFEIAERCPCTDFYAYTKSIPYFIQKDGSKSKFIPRNMRIIFSAGGKCDDLIDPLRHRHATVFLSEKGLKSAGYVDSSESDLVAATTESLKIGLILH